MARRWSSSRSPPLSRLWFAAYHGSASSKQARGMSARLAHQLLGVPQGPGERGAAGAPVLSAHRHGHGGGLSRGRAAEAAPAARVPLLTPAPPSGGLLERTTLARVVELTSWIGELEGEGGVGGLRAGAATLARFVESQLFEAHAERGQELEGVRLEQEQLRLEQAYLRRELQEEMLQLQEQQQEQQEQQQQQQLKVLKSFQDFVAATASLVAELQGSTAALQQGELQLQQRLERVTSQLEGTQQRCAVLEEEVEGLRSSAQKRPRQEDEEVDDDDKLVDDDDEDEDDDDVDGGGGEAAAASAAGAGAVGGEEVGGKEPSAWQARKMAEAKGLDLLRSDKTASGFKGVYQKGHRYEARRPGHSKHANSAGLGSFKSAEAAALVEARGA